MSFLFSKKFARKCTKLAAIAAVAGITAFAPGCGSEPLFYSPGTELDHIYSRIFLTDYNIAWQATLDALKRFEKTVQNRQGGVMQTSWVDNTAEKNFSDAFGGDATYLNARYRFKVSIAPGNYNGKPSVKISILKDQLIQRDLLEGWKQVPSDALEENSFLYRIGRIIFIKQKLKQLEDQKLQQVIEEGV